ncbi:MAG: hypothetical protein Q9187_001926 [Circinaria calcarea]
MFLLPWGVGTRHEKVAAKEAKLSAAIKQQSSTTVENMLIQKMKRKRRDSEDPVTASDTRKPNRSMSECMSHVEVPAGNDYLNAEFKLPTGSVGSNHNDAVEEKSQAMNVEPTSIRGNAAQTGFVTPRASLNVEIEAVEAQTFAVDVTTLTPLQQAIESQFSLEILLKHKELRLIDQEIAKCQIALEQLRRCRVIPFPASSSSIETMQAISKGEGPALEQRTGCQQAPHPPPWGVVEGPYSRHYATWLLPDPTFDGGQVEEAKTQRRAEKKLPDRATRGSKADKSTTVKVRSQRGSAGSRLHALPAGYPEPKEEKGPMIVKRSTDGQMVKLVCLDCRRENFNSAQGFINHCRIAHSRGFASHDAAALACGEEVEYTESGTVMTDPNGGCIASAGLVHPLIRSALNAKSAPSSLTASMNKRKQSQSKLDTSSHSMVNQAQSFHSEPINKPSTLSFQPNPQLPLVPSSATPHLSALFAKLGRGGNLDEMVREATTKTELPSDAVSDNEDDDEAVDVIMEDAQPQTQSATSLNPPGVLRGGRLPARATRSPAPLERPTSSKGPERRSRKPGYLNTIIPRPSYSSPYADSIAPSDPHLDGQHPDSLVRNHQPENSIVLSASPTLNLSPNTIESNPAPSLVSDDGDYEDPHSESDAPSSAVGDEEEDGYLDVEVEDEEIGGASVDPELATAAKAHPARRSSALRSPTAMRRERHVSFAGPSRRERKGEGRKENK